MSRLTVAVLSLENEDTPFIAEVAAAAERSDISFVAHCGTIEEIYGIVEDWTILPEILLIQVPQGREPMEILQAMASACRKVRRRQSSLMFPMTSRPIAI